MNSSDVTPPRKVVIGTMMQKFWGIYPGLEQRLSNLCGFVDQMAERSASQGYDGALDLVVLPENAVCDEEAGTAEDKCIPFQGRVHDTMAAKAREYNTYLIVPLYVDEDGVRSNAAILLDRSGNVAGTYRKVHPVYPRGATEPEGGVQPGAEHPVFTCDFGKLGIQICFDMRFDEGWQTLAKGGAEIVAWPTQSPQTVLPAARAMQHSFYIVSSNWRDNATVFEPTGMIAAQTETEPVLVHQIDLSYVILHWQPPLRNGAIFTETYGDRAGFHYSEREDSGLFWSNDPDMPIAQMVRELDLETGSELLERSSRLRRE